ncbi:hypothetical protein HUG10_11710 [Halorarum halophilum]|uniref:Uncharacterized protein n=1 Tax=Halorarum halophilum TaxID=2743090 RepID=A0A7D5K8H0_9EURY|nr:hypothetical protein [Halobaculum halophilum]QLG28174.1 hypothetical protein HUG10_11710 [Halobaculum halophilum]
MYAWAEWFFLGLVYPLRWWMRGFFPYLYHVVGSLARTVAYLIVTLPLMAVILFLVSLPVGGPEVAAPPLFALLHRVDALYLAVEASPAYQAGVVMVVYFVGGILPYQPKDWHRKQYRTHREPKAPFSWEFTWYKVLAVLPPAVIFALIWGAPNLITRVPYKRLGVFTALVAVMYILSRLVRWHALTRYDLSDVGDQMSSKTLTVNGNLAQFLGLTIAAYCLYTQSLSTVFIGVALSLSLRLRDFRRMLYEDRDGFTDIEPRLWVWGALARVPFGYVIVLAYLTRPARVVNSPILLACLFSPVVTLTAYYVVRYYVTDGRMYLQFPRAAVAPDPYDIKEDLRRNSGMFNHKQAQAIHPRNLMWNSFRKVGDTVRTLNSALEAANINYEDAMFRGYNPINLVKMEKKNGSSYYAREDHLRDIEAHLHVVRSQVDSFEGPYADAIVDAVGEVEAAIEDARERNEEIGSTTWDDFRQKLSR